LFVVLTAVYLASLLLPLQSNALEHVEHAKKLQQSVHEIRNSLDQQTLRLQQDEQRGLHGRWLDAGAAAAQALHLFMQVLAGRPTEAQTGEVIAALHCGFTVYAFTTCVPVSKFVSTHKFGQIYC
jgi:hypothetical protein